MNQSKSTLIIISFVLIALGVTGWVFYSNQAGNEVSTLTQVTEAEPSAQPELGRTEIAYTAQPGITSLEQLLDEVQDVAVEESQYGKFVDAIEGHQNGTDGKYWSFYVNDEMAQVGADTYIQKEGDRVLWKFQKL